MFRLSQSGRVRTVSVNEDSPLRDLDPRAKLFMSMCASVTVMLPLERLAIFFFVYIIFLLWARLLPEMARQVWRLKWILIVLFLFDWWIVSLDLAVIIVLRLVLLAGVFTLFFATSTASELGLALERLGIPYRFAFSINLAFLSIGLLQEEWHTIREAQQSRGVATKFNGFRQLIKQLGDLVALTVPAVMLTTRRAWSITEAAYARGFDSPKRISFFELQMKLKDWLFSAGALAIVVVLFWR